MHCCDIVKVEQKRHEDAISYGLHPRKGPAPVAPAQSVKEQLVVGREGYFESSTPLVQPLSLLK